MEAPGDRIGRYRIVGVLGQGGMGVVYRAHDERLGRDVALKVVRPDARGSDPEAAARLVREARAAAAIEHRNAVAIYDVGEEGGAPFIAMELVHGETLRERTRRGAPWRTALGWLLDVAAALAFAHHKGIVHRDVKPENILVRVDGTVKVLDFGIARRLDRPVDPTGETETPEVHLPTITKEGVVIGTPFYMAPEQLEGRAVDGRADQFAWGVVAYEALAGRSPWDARDGIALVAQILGSEPRPLREVAPEVPAEVEAVVARTLAKRPEDRFASMDEVIAALAEVREAGMETGETLERAPSGSGARGRREGPGERAARFSGGVGGRRRIGILLVLFGVAAALTAVVLASRSGNGGVPATAGTALGSMDASADGGGVPVTELPPPRSSSGAALAAYAAGMQTWRDGSIDRAAAFFEKAIALDPGMGAAYLRIALRSPRSPAERAAFFKDAVDRRASLEEHEAVLLDAFAPCVQDRAREDRWCVERAAEAARLHPKDAELAFWSAKALLDAGRLREAVTGLDHAIELDARFGLAWVVRIHALSYLGDFEEAEGSIRRCTEVSPSDRCIGSLAKLQRPLGRCAELETTARSILGVDPENVVGLLYLTQAQAGQDRPFDAVATIARQTAEAFPDFAREGRRRWVAQSLAEVQGDFTTALAILGEREKAIAGSRDQQSHAELSEARIRMETEIGRAADAGAAARAYLESRVTLASAGAEDDVRMRSETPGFALLAELRAGLISRAELRAERDRFVASWRPRLGPGYLPYLWLDAYAASASDEEDAREALDAAASFGGLPRFFYYDPLQDLVGRTLLLAGRADEAIVWLERAAHACELPFDVRPITARLLLGLAREQKGEKDAACAAYAGIVTRWGNAKPRSVTAEEARRRIQALGCR